MIIIGVNGHSGAGKTTFSNLIFSDKNKLVVHLDEIFASLKKNCFQKYSTQYEKSNGDKAIYLNKNSHLYDIINAKYTEPIYTKLKLIIAQFLIYKTIHKYSNSGLEYLILEGNMLEIYSLDKFCDIKIFIHSDKTTRYQRVLNRDKKGLNSDLDIIGTFNYDSKRRINLKNYIIVNNCSSLQIFKTKIAELEAKLRGNHNKIKQKK